MKRIGSGGANKEEGRHAFLEKDSQDGKLGTGRRRKTKKVKKKLSKRTKTVVTVTYPHLRFLRKTRSRKRESLKIDRKKMAREKWKAKKDKCRFLSECGKGKRYKRGRERGGKSDGGGGRGLLVGVLVQGLRNTPRGKSLMKEENA